MGKLEKQGNLVTCNDLKVPFSSTKPDDIQRYIKQKPGKDGKRRNNKAPQTVSAKPQKLPGLSYAVNSQAACTE